MSTAKFLIFHMLQDQHKRWLLFRLVLHLDTDRFVYNPVTGPNLTEECIWGILSPQFNRVFHQETDFMVYEDKRLAAYHGQEPYLFLSYSHRDADQAAEIILRFKQEGFRVWYDEGVIPATEWDENIARAIGNSSFFVSLISEAYLASSNCLDELNYARDLEKPQLLVYLEDVQLPDGLAMRLGRLLAIYKDRFDEPENFYSRIFRAKGIKICRGEAGTQNADEPEEEAEAAYITASPTNRSGCLVALLAVLILLTAVALGWHYRSQLHSLVSGGRYSQQSSTQSGVTLPPVSESPQNPIIEPTDTDTSADIITTENPTPTVAPTIEPLPTTLQPPSPTPTPTSMPLPSEVVETVIVGPPVTDNSMDSETPGDADHTSEGSISSDLITGSPEDSLSEMDVGSSSEVSDTSAGEIGSGSGSSVPTPTPVESIP